MYFETLSENRFSIYSSVFTGDYVDERHRSAQVSTMTFEAVKQDTELISYFCALLTIKVSGMFLFARYHDASLQGFVVGNFSNYCSI